MPSPTFPFGFAPARPRPRETRDAEALQPTRSRSACRLWAAPCLWLLGVAAPAAAQQGPLDLVADSGVECLPLNETGINRVRRIVGTNAFAECLDHAVRWGGEVHQGWHDEAHEIDTFRGPYKECLPGGVRVDANLGAPINETISRLLSAYNSPMGVRVNCSDNLGNTAQHRDFEGFSGVFRTSRTQLAKFDEPGLNRAASLFTHELAHNFEYHHGAFDGGPNDTCGYPGSGMNSLNKIAAGCSAMVGHKSDEKCGAVTCADEDAVPMIKHYFDSDECVCVRLPFANNEGGSGGDGMGSSVAAGDFDGDGIDDLAVGVPHENRASGSGPGAVMIFRGTPTGLKHWTVISQRDVVFDDYGRRVYGSGMGEGASDNFGASLAAGDLNGDGAEDLVVGIPGERLGSRRSGYVIAIPGSLDRPGVPGGLLPSMSQGISQTGMGSNETGDQFGFAVAVGDIDRNGRADLVVGAPGEVYYGDASGYAFVFRGLSGRGTELVRVWKGLHQEMGSYSNGYGDAFGTSVAIGNLDADLPSEVVVGAPGNANGQGAAFVFHPYGSGFALRDGVFTSAREGDDGFGTSLAIGDFAADGGPMDLAVSCMGCGYDDVGRIFVYSRQSSTMVRVQTLGQGDFGGDSHAYDLFGASLAAGQIDGVAGDDLIIGAPGEKPPGGPAGAGVIFYATGSTSGLVPQDWLRQGHLFAPPENAHAVIGYPGSNSPMLFDKEGVRKEFAHEHFGAALATGDFNGSGRDSVAIGTPQDEVVDDVVGNSDPFFEGSGSVFVAEQRDDALELSLRADQVGLRFGDQDLHRGQDTRRALPSYYFGPRLGDSVAPEFAVLWWSASQGAVGYVVEVTGESDSFTLAGSPADFECDGGGMCRVDISAQVAPGDYSWTVSSALSNLRVLESQECDQSYKDGIPTPGAECVQRPATFTVQ